MPRSRFDALRLALADGERVHVFGRAELFASRADFRLRALGIERLGLGDHLAARERLKTKLAAEGLFADERKRALPRFPRRIGLVTGNDAAAKQDVLATIAARFPPARIIVAEAYVQGPRAAGEIVTAIDGLASQRNVDVIVIARGGGSFEDLLPFSEERLVRAVAACPVPIVSAVGHEQDTPLCDLAADVRASTPTMAAKLVVPELAQLSVELDRTRETLRRAASGLLGRKEQRLERSRERLRAAPALAVERKRAALESTAGRLIALSPKSTLRRGYAIVRTADGTVVTSASAASPGERVEVELNDGGFGARVER
jgi:exodeoxyribonuclease VII large subunit